MKFRYVVNFFVDVEANSEEEASDIIRDYDMKLPDPRITYVADTFDADWLGLQS